MKEKIQAKVLLVDDEEEFITSLSERLEMRGLSVTTAIRGIDALNLIEEKEFDAIILDLSMPGMDGLETLRRIRESNPEAEIIILTGHGSIKTSIEAMKLGAEDYLEKPVDLPELLSKIKAAKDKRVMILEKQSQDEIERILKSKFW